MCRRNTAKQFRESGKVRSLRDSHFCHLRTSGDSVLRLPSPSQRLRQWLQSSRCAIYGAALHPSNSFTPYYDLQWPSGSGTFVRARHGGPAAAKCSFTRRAVRSSTVYSGAVLKTP
ncbi:hypothetical protein Y032_0092g2567 [Ancylostoma ceylanicum]|uniref:Uncharacterized protein n=1 Tax=Ancylostoma ceylanicum TaxID=53326 RepID=A0A016TM07_9BILA|nr:hypothetical protein Y032_0092g2567 [Ancylostoma ceylanicum]